ncbi:hypothetical protein HAX54_035314 [Datura stramonium]|uniref:Uncharacterized protein n=1 Tax=Datura stramonium TaxID=4076 RepID=A0ABS8SF45_DATST|nr:hypothetical protein [Datura stramonium]
MQVQPRNNCKDHKKSSEKPQPIHLNALFCEIYIYKFLCGKHKGGEGYLKSCPKNRAFSCYYIEVEASKQARKKERKKGTLLGRIQISIERYKEHNSVTVIAANLS